jgi:SAM-dependent methyltransferase
MVLDVGCGTVKRETGPECIGIDACVRSAADVIWDLDEFPWPLESNTFDRIYMSHIIEHLSDVLGAMHEIHRVARNDADVFIVTPHFSSHNSYTDPTHVRHLAARSFEYFTNIDFATFTGSSLTFSIESLNLTFGSNILLDTVARWLVRRNMTWYEHRAAWMFPAQDIHCHLKAHK